MRISPEIFANGFPRVSITDMHGSYGGKKRCCPALSVVDIRD